MLIKSCWMLATYEGMTVTVSAWRPKLLPNWNLRYVWLYLVSSGRHVLFTINSVQLFTSCSWYWKILIEERLLSSKWNQYIIKGILWNAFCFEKQAFQIYFVFLTSEGLFLKKNIFWCVFFFNINFLGSWSLAVWHILYRKILDNNYVVENSERDYCLQWKGFDLRLEKENNRNNIHLNFF